MKEIYLDNAATTKPCEAAIKALNECLTENYGNASSLHRKGLAAFKTLEKSRRIIADSLGCLPQEVVFTSCATESNNTALKSAAKKYGKRKKTIVVSSVEHACVRNTCKYLAKNGYKIKLVHPRDDGKFYVEDFVNAVDDDTFLVSAMVVNNETGYRLPVEKIFHAVKRRDKNILCHCDAVQSYMKNQFNVKQIGCDLLSISAHKIYAVKGIGVLYIKKGVVIHPLLHGGGQENGIRSGTESIPLIAAFGAAVEFMESNLYNNTVTYEFLSQYLRSKLENMDNIRINSDYNTCVPYIINFSVVGIRSETMLHFLEQKGIYVSSGSACSKGAVSGVLGEFGIDAACGDSAIRVSFSYDNTKEDIDALCDAIQEAQKVLVKAY